MTTASKVRKTIGTILLVMCGINVAVTLTTGGDTKAMLAFVVVYGIVTIVLLVWPTSKKSKLKYQQKQAAIQQFKMQYNQQNGVPIPPNPQVYSQTNPNPTVEQPIYQNYNQPFAPPPQAVNYPIMNKPKKSMVGITVFGCIMLAFVLLVIGGTVYAFNNPEIAKKAEKASTASLTQESLGVTEAQAAQIDVVLNDCGVKDIIAIERDDLLDNMTDNGEVGFRIKAKEIKNVILYLKDGQVFSIRYADYDIYSNSTKNYDLSSFYITFDEMLDYMNSCENQINQLLKSPSTAKYPLYDQWGFSKSPEEIVIQGYVDAQNAFGATLRSEFQFRLTPDATTITSLIFEGEELMD